ncbi:acyl-CoA thioesterase [Flavipsychrobacter stenotrophus]|uniref:Acyl-CoA thioesterase n=1 Tax=Flavipsychrobacter stenotrophus TaxID=2077091 RepID=A0A2S7STM1_9BACT|nr:acyl-CoA thioesterase [Flavipsychrobacter stenotrophus]PQJ10068.1 acyl-CoA thioesterase [Flavipsychrobacter stenotrophus]
MDTTGFKTVRYSKTTITELMIPSYANFGGKIHGGILLSLMDKVAYVCAAKHAGTYCVTASIDSVDFLAPVEVGELVSLNASVNYVGSASLIVGIRVSSENVKTQVIKHTNTSYFTMVAMGDDHKPVQVPGLILETKDEVRRFVETMKRKELSKQNRNTLNSIKMPMKLESYNELLTHERCLVKTD